MCVCTCTAGIVERCTRVRVYGLGHSLRKFQTNYYLLRIGSRGHTDAVRLARTELNIVHADVQYYYGIV